MQVSVETTSGLERRLTIVVPSETFENQISSRLTEAGSRVRLPGFRPGKVPLKEVRRRYGPAVRAEIAGELMQHTFVEAVQQEALSPAGSPNLEVVKMDPGIDFEFTATFEVFPKVELADLANIEVTRPEATINDDDIDSMVERLREQRKSFEEVDRAVVEGDRVTVDFVGKLDGEVFPGGEGEGVSFEVGAKQMIEDFDKGVTGQTKDCETEFDASFPDDYQAEDMRGKTVQFSVTVKKIETAKLPALDDEFFTGFGIEEGGEAAFRDDVRSNMQRELDGAITTQVKNQVMDELAKLHEVQLPGAMVHSEIHVLKDQMRQQMQTYADGQQPALDMPDDLFKAQAERRVLIGLVVNEIVQTAELTKDDQKVRERIETMAASYAQPQQVVNWYYSNEKQLQQIEMAVLEDQVVDHILQSAQVETLTASYGDIIAGNALPETST